jgi:hypothetical protein
MGKDPVDEPFTETVTAAVTEDEPRVQTPWEIVGMDEKTWRSLEIPAFLRRTDTTVKVSPAPIAPAPVPAAAASAGTPSGATTKSEPATNMGVTGGFEHFRVDPEEIERKIKAEADALWRNWMPTKTDRKRPRLSTYIKQVRKQYYP